MSSTFLLKQQSKISVTCFKQLVNRDCNIANESIFAKTFFVHNFEMNLSTVTHRSLINLHGEHLIPGRLFASILLDCSLVLLAFIGPLGIGIHFAKCFDIMSQICSLHRDNESTSDFSCRKLLYFFLFRFIFVSQLFEKASTFFFFWEQQLRFQQTLFASMLYLMTPKKSSSKQCRHFHFL